MTVLTKIGCEVAALPPLPSLQARMVEGYRGAMSWILGGVLTTQDFIGFLALWLEPDWRAYLSRLKSGSATPESRRDSLATLAPSVARTMGKYLNRKIENVSVDYLDWLDATWREAWETCQTAIGYKWKID